MLSFTSGVLKPTAGPTRRDQKLQPQGAQNNLIRDDCEDKQTTFCSFRCDDRGWNSSVPQLQPPSSWTAQIQVQCCFLESHHDVAKGIFD